MYVSKCSLSGFLFRTSLYLALIMCVQNLFAQAPRLTLDLSKQGISVSPRLYGLMTEEINHSYDGGLYAELIRNRIFKDDTTKPDGWILVKDDDTRATMQLIGANPLNVPKDQAANAINDALTTCLQLKVEAVGKRAAIANTGFWGIPVKPETVYKASFYAKAGVADTAGNQPRILTVSIESSDGSKIFASGTITMVKSIYWKKYELTLVTAADMKPTSAHFMIAADKPGTYYFNLVSLFPPTYNKRTNGNRIDIMQLMADMKPTFLRFPGGNFLEGDYFASRFDWKNTLGAMEQRAGHPGNWNYRATDGLGLLEFLYWCEDLKIEPVLAVFAGYSLKGDHVDAGPLLEPYIADALDEIEYVTGNTQTKWGAKRAADGHPKPFRLNYIEIGNEDWFDKSGSYDGRFTQFSKAIKAKYPKLHCISTVPESQRKMKVISAKPEIIDEHYYRNAWQMYEDADHYDSYSRTNRPKIFVGEWATREGTPTTNMNAALGDAAWMTGMERNSDVVIMSCYAPLFANVNKATPTEPRGWQWESNLIGYDALNAYGSPSYYAQKMFNNYLGNFIVPILSANIPMKIPTKKDSANKRYLPKKASVPSLYFVATKNNKSGAVFLKVVNISSQAQPVNVELTGASNISADGIWTVLKSESPDDSNSIENPEKITPVTSKISGLGRSFTKIFEPYSVNVIQINTK